MFIQNARQSFRRASLTNVLGVLPLMDFIIGLGFAPTLPRVGVISPPAQLEVLPTLPPCLRDHGWPILLPEWEVYAGFLLRDDGFSKMSPIDPPTHGFLKRLELFLDGTCAYPRETRLRYAAWAVTMVLGPAGSLDNQLLLGGHVSGLCQSAFRAELTAAVRGHPVGSTEEAASPSVVRLSRGRQWDT